MKNRISSLLLLAFTTPLLFAQTAGPTILPTQRTQFGYINNAFSLSFSCSGCGSNITGWNLSGSLPPGLAFNGNTAIISGVPSGTGVYGVTVSVMVNNQTAATAQYTLSIDTKLDFVTPADLGTVTAGTSVTRSIQVTQSGITESSTPPPGLKLSFQPGDTVATLSGTVPAVAVQTTYSFTVYANSQSRLSSQSASRTFFLVVNPTPSLVFNLPSGQVGTPYSGTIRATGGTSPFTYSASGSFPPGLVLDQATGAVTGTPTSAGSFSFTASVRDASNATGSSPVTLVITAVTPTITTATLPNGTVGTAYPATTLAATGGTPGYTWSVTTGSLPAGLTLSTAGVLSGTPTAAGTSSFTILVTDSQRQTGTKAFSITIVTGVSITTTSLPDGAVKAAYSATVAATGGTPPYNFYIASGAALPPGLTLTTATGAIAGTPTTEGTYTFTVGVTDTGQRAATKDLKIVIGPAPPPLSFPSASLPAGVRGKAYSAQLSATGGVPAYAFTLTAGSLPAGLSLGSAGAIGGTPTASGTSNFTAQVKDQAGSTATQSFSIVVTEPPTPPAITTTSLPDGTVGVNYSAALVAQGTEPLAFSITDGSLPAGLSLDSGGTVTGNPTTAGTSSFTVQVSDGNKPALTASRAFTIAIQLPSLPSVSVTQVPDTAPSTSQPVFGVSLAQTFPVDLDGTATLTFQPDAGPGDPDVRFANGRTTTTFRIPAGQSTATSSDTLAFQTGTTSGTITITVVLQAGAQALTPNPATTRTIKVNKAAPVITSVKINRTSAGFEVAIIGYSNTREITASTFHFTGTGLTSSDFPVAVTSAFQTWYNSTASNPFGTQFLFTMPFTLSQGAISALTSVQVTLSNSVGSGTGQANF